MAPLSSISIIYWSIDNFCILDIYLFLFKIYLQLTVNKKYIYLAYLKAMLIYVNFHKKAHIYIDMTGNW